MKSYLFEDRFYQEVHADGLPFYQHKTGDPCDPDLLHLFSWQSFPTSGSSLLELGCGDAFITVFLAGMGLTVTGVDSSPTAIAHGKQNLVAAGVEANLHVGDVCNLEFVASGEFGFILDSHCFHCITDYGERALFLRECRRVLQPGGSLFLACMAEQSMDWTKDVKDLPWQREYNTDERGCFFESLVPPGGSDRVKSRIFIREDVLRTELEAAGFRIVRFETYTPDTCPEDRTFLVQVESEPSRLPAR